MGSFLGRDALTGLAISGGERVVAIPISYKGLPEESRLISIDQGWRLSGLPVRTVYTENGETRGLPAPQVPRTDSPFESTSRGHMFVIKESLYERLLEEGLSYLSELAEFLPEAELYKGATSIEDCLERLSHKPAVSRFEIFKSSPKPAYFENWYSPEFFPNVVFTDKEDVRKLLELFIFINGALYYDFPAAVPSYPSGVQESRKEKILLAETLNTFNARLDETLEYENYENLEELLAEIKSSMKALKKVKKDCEEALEDF